MIYSTHQVLRPPMPTTVDVLRRSCNGQNTPGWGPKCTAIPAGVIPQGTRRCHACKYESLYTPAGRQPPHESETPDFSENEREKGASHSEMREDWVVTWDNGEAL